MCNLRLFGNASIIYTALCQEALRKENHLVLQCFQACIIQSVIFVHFCVIHYLQNASKINYYYNYAFLLFRMNYLIQLYV